jgi:DNA topoisomerase-1
MHKLVVTEKFNTALRIAVVLSDGKMKRERSGPVAVFSFTRDKDDYTVVGLRGHIVELDYPEELTHWSLSTLPKLLEADPIRSITEPSIVATLRTLSPDNGEVILATDWDREGEVIAAECLEILQESNPHIRVKRAQYSAMTRSDVERAFANLKELDMNLAAAGMARQNVDLMWGALLTRYLTLATRAEYHGAGQGGPLLSVGRVQTPTLYLLVERDRAIKTFKPDPFWEIQVTVSTKEGKFVVKHEHGRWFDKKEADAVFEKIKAAKDGMIRDFKEENVALRPPIPFSTTLFLAESTRLGFGAAQAMRMAEELYTGGLISYPRTDNTVYPPSLNPKTVLGMLAEGAFSKEAKYCLDQERIRPTRGKFETTDHPPIYPTANLDMRKAAGEKARLYELVARRYLATVAPEALGIKRRVLVDISGERLEGEGFRLTDRGWYNVYPYMEPRESDLPQLKVGEHVRIEEPRLVEGHTEPPRRFTQGSLIQEMERLGLGTKSTRHEIVQKLFERHYIMPRGLEPTTSGLAVAEALQANASLVTRPEMTSRLEEDMNAIAQGQKTLDDVVSESREMLREVYGLLVQNAQGVRDAIQGALDKQHFAGNCVLCGGALRIYTSQLGKRWVQCVNNPRTCTASYQLPSSGHVEPTTSVCQKCHVPLIRVVHRGQRPQDTCINPACETHQDSNRLGTCPSCKSPLHLKYSYRGKRFVTCTAFPACRVSYPLPQRGRLDKHEEPCPSCGAPIVTIVEAGRRPWTLCVNPECPSKKQAAAAPVKVPVAAPPAKVPEVIAPAKVPEVAVPVNAKPKAKRATRSRSSRTNTKRKRDDSDAAPAA